MTALLTRRWLVACVTTLALLLAGCAVEWVSNHDRAAVARIDEFSKSSLKLFQDLLVLPPAQRAAAVTGALAPRYGEVDTQLRLHLLHERARAKNEPSIGIAENLLAKWQTFSASHRGKDATALGDATLAIERTLLERELGAALIAEEAKKFGGGAAK